MKAVPAGKIWRIPNDPSGQFKRTGAADPYADRLAVRFKAGAQCNDGFLQIVDDAFAALRKPGGQRDEFGDLPPGTVHGNPQVGPTEVYPDRKLTFNRFAGHFSDHFASNQQKLAPHLQFRDVGLAHRF
jgi:hypothetical protein